MKAKSWFRVHSFTGVITGLLLFVICWSGTVAVLSNEIDWLVTPEARVDPGDGRASWSSIVSAVQSAYPEATVTWLSEPLYSGSAAQVLVDLPDQDAVWVYVDPYTSEVLGSHSYFNVQRFFRSFHRNLFMPGIGIYLVSLFGLTLLVSLVAALMFYKRWWRRFLRWPRRRSRAYWSELHKVGGLWSLWFLVVIAVTGIWYLVEASRADFVDGKVSYAGDSDYAVHELDTPPIDTDRPVMSIDTLLDKAAEHRPDLQVSTVYLGASAIEVHGQSDHLLVRDRANRIHLDRYTGEVIYNQTPHDYSLYWRWSDTADPLHFGNFGGLWSKTIWFVFGLALCGLILTGTYLHARRLAGQANASHRWAGTGAALAISLLVLAASVPFGLHEARDWYGPIVDGNKELPSLAPGVGTVIAVWIIVTLGIIAAWIWMLWRPSATR